MVQEKGESETKSYQHLGCHQWKTSLSNKYIDIILSKIFLPVQDLIQSAWHGSGCGACDAVVIEEFFANAPIVITCNHRRLYNNYNQ